MLFAGLLGARKKVPVWRVGRAQTWMRGHLWLGLLSLPLILYHAGFVWHGPLTSVLMILLIIVWLSGITGAVIQHYVPEMLLREVPLETIYEEIPHVRTQLLDEADRVVSGTALQEIYAGSIRPALADGGEVAFAQFYRLFPSEVHPALKSLESICEEERQLTRQRKLYHVLHTWLLVHVPLSIVLLVLGAIHAIIALRY